MKLPQKLGTIRVAHSRADSFANVVVGIQYLLQGEGEVLHIVDVVEGRYRCDILSNTGTPGAAVLRLLPLPPRVGGLLQGLQGDGEDLPTAHLGEVVNPRELQERGHAVEEGADDEPVQGRGVVHLRQPRPAVQRDGGERQDGRDPWGEERGESGFIGLTAN